MAKRILGIIFGLAIVGGAIAGSKKSDPDKLAQVGEIVGRKIKGALPEGSKVAGPLVAFKTGDLLPVEEKVRIRIRSDRRMDGAEVQVLHAGATGEVKLRGIVPTAALAARAQEIAADTVGVTKVINELAVPEER